ncbi:MAG: hypothetical protein KME32_09880 [Mojavia pulchra JT2-VF2]|uniref:Uncharacterized protein n=1 Tax=Mojavia pulchra JT2-VF2 TaxID=287848 RepID=A0A951PY83_9NOST|nr:hypothetical protein [Mojavia pulchra JT2-VF2]
MTKSDRPYEDTPVFTEQAPSKLCFQATARSAVGQQGALRDRLFLLNSVNLLFSRLK